MKTLKIGDEINVNGLVRTITRIRWSEKNKGELLDKEAVLYPALDWCILDTDKGERLTVDVICDTQELRLKTLTVNGLSIRSNQYDFPCKTYWYISNKLYETYHHKYNKWRAISLKQMNTYAFYNAQDAVKTFFTLPHNQIPCYT